MTNSARGDGPTEATAGGVRDRDTATALAWLPWRLISQGEISQGLGTFDDEGTWWDMVTRQNHPMAAMKAVLAEILEIVPMRFDFVDSIVEGNHVALMVESHGAVSETAIYNNVYTFVTELAADRDVIVAVREYVDTLHASTALMPSVMSAIAQRGGKSALMDFFSGSERRQ
ncbi:nuclear transport factor 2 family protein [Mycobacterium colombiense]